MKTRHLLLLCLLFVVSYAGQVMAQDEPAPRPVKCMACHDAPATESWAHAEVACADCHTQITRKPPRRSPHDEPVESVACGSCHDRAERGVARSIHGEQASCQDCHGSAHEVVAGDTENSSLSHDNEMMTCGACHEQVLEAYKSSVHAHGLMVSGLTSAPSCTDCHGNGHMIQAETNERSAVHVSNIPETCGDCHAGVLRTWKASSAHGEAFFNGDENAPNCETCHDSHSISEPVGEQRMQYPDECGDCHTTSAFSSEES